MFEKNKISSIIKVCWVLSFVFSLKLSAQNIKIPMLDNTNRVYVQYSDSILEAFYYRGDKKIKTKDNLFYYWYGAQDIKHTRGAFDGKLLHGKFILFYRNKDLLSKGNFRYGLKDGEWKSWYLGGERKSKEKWRKGTVIGAAYYYGINGNVRVVRKLNHLGNGSITYYTDEGNMNSKEYYSKNMLDHKNTYQLNDKGKLIEVKQKKEREKGKDNDQSQKQHFFHFKKLFHKKAVSEQPLNKKKKIKEKKSKSTKIKIQKFRQISPAGIGT
jgi:antitoxin component YwqK of YwqJK toxin-antitoxin module